MELIGRDDDVASIRAFFETAGVRGGALLLVGEAGVGKTAVLDAFAAVETGRGTRVLRAAGVQFEAEVNYSVLNQLLFPLGDDMAPLTDAHRGALRVALGYELGSLPDRLVVSNAAVLWLRSVAAETPLLIIIDDLHWVDRASAEVLGFVARRLVGSPIAFLGACRTAERGFFSGGGLSEMTLPPLAADAARTLVDRRFPTLAPAVRRRLLSEARGNPLALLELPSALDGDQRTDFTALPTVLPLPDRLQAMFASRVGGLPERCRLMMLLGVLGGTTEVTRLREAGGDTCDLDDLRPAEDDRLVQVTANRLSFRHPLIRAAVVQACSERDRRWAHGALAEVVDAPERRVRHLAESVVGPDEAIAGRLEATAQALLRQGDAIAAVAALTRAAELSPAPADRSRRLAEAAYVGAEAGGEMATATRLLGDARRSGSLDTHSLHAAAAAAHLLINSDGDVTTAYRLLAAAIEAGDHGYDAQNPVLVEAMYSVQLISWWVGTEEAGRSARALVDRLVPEPPPLLRVYASVFPDPVRATPEDVATLDTLIDSVGTGEDPTRLVRIGTAALFADRLSRLRGPERHLAQLSREGRGPARRHLGALIHLAIDAFLSGRWPEAQELSDEGIAVSAEHGFTFFRWYFDWVHALVAAGRGEVEAARRLTDDLLRWAVAHQATGVTFFGLQARALGELAAGDHEGAYRTATRISPAGRLAPYRPTAMWAGLDLVEAALHTGRRSEAVAHAAAMREARLDELSPRLRLLTAAAAALTADDECARDRFEAALATPDAELWPFELARVRLAYGERLRRLRDTGAAREHLTIAHDVLTGLGAVPWQERAAGELRATGMTRRSTTDVAVTLTPQEREIADLAGAGLTNKQIGQKLFISHRTVGDHLYKIFPKLGITSRAALRDALTAYDQQG
ncbi:LuxR family transcriptional regulator [Sphaerisporangium melleum]|uniref:LuxR family transcriptional regulator n=1 Tax=Sphaerisporangium melleum TaxID=321316 RepID=A0A917VE48_9ACTN|nr:LuxR family transcriptional regulator [Sphaerisporangium melleum]GGK67945.1 LuxR family transcriptional regulator [Sphaerisporangium melleum]GII68831.1 LuxR family transcriptional regulator [Sphaerisporangium melleum]